ncbi:MAG: hypothetical protein Q9208_001931 [Pyrenodesmia sp. 3 TL-2023]
MAHSVATSVIDLFRISALYLLWPFIGPYLTPQPVCANAGRGLSVDVDQAVEYMLKEREVFLTVCLIITTQCRLEAPRLLVQRQEENSQAASEAVSDEITEAACGIRYRLLTCDILVREQLVENPPGNAEFVGGNQTENASAAATEVQKGAEIQLVDEA